MFLNNWERVGEERLFRDFCWEFVFLGNVWFLILELYRKKYNFGICFGFAGSNIYIVIIMFFFLNGYIVFYCVNLLI